MKSNNNKTTYYESVKTNYLSAVMYPDKSTEIVHGRFFAEYEDI